MGWRGGVALGSPTGVGDMTVFSRCCPGGGSGRMVLVPVAALWALVPLLARAGTQRQRVGLGTPPPPLSPHPAWGQQCGDPKLRGEAGPRAGAACGQGVTVPSMVVVTHRASAWHRGALGLGRSRCSTSDATNIIPMSHPPSPTHLQHPGSNRDPRVPLSQGVSSSIPPLCPHHVPISGLLGEFEGPARGW